MATKKPPPDLIAPEWGPQPGEPDMMFRGFAAYRDLGPDRTVPRAAAELGTSARTCQKWSAAWSWPGRARLWDGHLDGRRTAGASRAAEGSGERWMAAREEFMSREVEAARELQGAALAIIRSIRVDPAATDPLPGRGEDEGEQNFTIRQKKDTVAALAGAASILKDASALAWGAINAGLGDEVPRHDATPGTTPGECGAA